MELGRDWQALSDAFYPKGSSQKVQDSRALLDPKLTVVVDQGRIVYLLDPLSASASGASSSEWVGRTVKELQAFFEKREIKVFERTVLDRWMAQSAEDGRVSAGPSSHLFDQAQNLKILAGSATHFLPRSLAGWWSKWLPRKYALAIRVGHQKSIQVLVVQRGRVDQFAIIESADLSVSPEHPGVFAREVAQIQDRYSLPVQGVLMNEADWNEWTRMSFPWRGMSRALVQKTLRLVPFRPGPAFLMILRGWLGL